MGPKITARKQVELFCVWQCWCVGSTGDCHWIRPAGWNDIYCWFSIRTVILWLVLNVDVAFAASCWHIVMNVLQAASWTFIELMLIWKIKRRKKENLFNSHDSFSLFPFHVFFNLGWISILGIEFWSNRGSGYAV